MNLGKENEAIEFKESLAEKDEAMRDIGAILNKKGAGILYFGVKNNGETLPLVVGTKTESDIAQKINASIEPAPFYSIETKHDAEGNTFIEVSFCGIEKPYRAKGCYYIRNGERSDLMSTSLLTEMLLQTRKNYDAWENSESDCSINDIDEDLIRKTFHEGNEC